MNIIITAGGTEEKIDDVRKITNMGTGRLGSLIAEALAEYEEVRKIYYICAPGAATPELSGENAHGAELALVRISGVGELKNRLTELLTGEEIHAVVHSMAVSDYSVKGMTTLEQLTQSAANALCRSETFLEALVKETDGQRREELLRSRLLPIIEECSCAIPADGKVSSDLEHLMLSMERTPKIIGMIKELRPQVILVGFKLLDGVPEEELLAVAGALLRKNSCDLVLANDLRNVRGHRHKALLLRPDGGFERMETKEEIAERIAWSVVENARGREREERERIG